VRRVVIESPLSPSYGRDLRTNLRYARWCCLHAVFRYEIPYASHLFAAQFLDDEDLASRNVGIRIGFETVREFDARIAYVDLGVSSGMRKGLAEANRLGQVVEYRQLAKADPGMWRKFLEGESPKATKGF
jgi:hypothetical protein